MAQMNIKQIRGASQGSILFLGTNSVVSENFNNLRWDNSSQKLVVDGTFQYIDGNQQGGYYLVSDNFGNASWTASVPGTSGTSGSSGSSGTSGTEGSSGTSGTEGSSGTSGTEGSSGTSGTEGSSGTSGTEGSSGTSGTEGSSGTSGTEGSSGTSGTEGSSGTSGTEGSSGTSGTEGSSGTSGTEGSSGTSGTEGSSGTSGTSGSSGSSGTGFNTILTPSDYRIITATGSSTNSAVAQPNLTFNPNTGVLSVTGSAVIGSTAGGTLFSVNGTSGQLFSITDSLNGSIFSVNDISGLPILEVFSDNTTVIGDYQAPSLYTTKTITANSGTTSVYSIATASYTGAFIDYNVVNGSNARSGNVTAIWLGSNIQYSETSTIDIGNTNPISFAFVISGTYAVLQAVTSTSGWTVKTIIRSI